jgi:hypothetical protein
MRIAIDKNSDGVIDNIVEVETLVEAAALFPNDTILDAVSAGVQIWWVRLGDGVYSEPAAPEAQPVPLSRLEFVRHCMGAGGMSPAMLVLAKAAPELGAMWIMLEMAEQVQRDDPEIAPGLALIESLGLLPLGALAVLDAWPRN